MKTSGLFFLLIILSFYSCKQQPDNQNSSIQKVNKASDQCLLVHIDSYEYYESIKLGSIIPKKWELKENVDLIDDFSEFYPLKRVFYIDRSFKIKNTTKLILWEYGCIREIGTFPEKYSNINIDSLQNDSILYFTSNHKKHKLFPNKVFTDTIITINYENFIANKTTNIIRIENYGLIQKKNIYNNSDWIENKTKQNTI